MHVVERMTPGGIETLVLDMVAGLAGRHTIFSLSGTSSDLARAWPRLDALDHPLEAFDRAPGISPKLVPWIASRLKVLRPDTVILHHIGPLIYGGLAARLARVPVIVHVEHDAWHYQNPRRRQLARLMFKLVRPRRVGVSNEIADRVTAAFGGDKITVIPPGIDMQHFRLQSRSDARRRLGLPPDAMIIGTSGRLVAVKNQVALIDAVVSLRQLRTAGAQPILVIAGEGPEREVLAARAATLGVQHAVHMLGHRDDMADVLPSFDVYALPSLNEGLPRSVLEAQAVGLPVVATDVGALAAAVCRQSGRLVRCSDPQALVAALASALTAPIDPTIPRAFVASRYALAETLDAFAQVIQDPERSHVALRG